MTTADRSDHHLDPPPPQAPSASSAATGAHRAQRQSPVPPAPLPVELDATPTLIAPWPTGATQPFPATPAAPPPHRTSVRPATAPLRAHTTATAPPAGGATDVSTPVSTDLPGTGPSDVTVPPGAPWASTPEPAVPPTLALRTEPRDDTPTAPTAPSPTEPAQARTRRPLRALAGTLVGIALGGLATWVVVFGQSRVLAAQTPAWDWSHDPLGILLVTAGAALLVAVVGLGLWSAATPVAAGAGTLLVGTVYLYVPATSQLATTSWWATESTAGSVQRAAVTATSGTVLVIGALLLAAGLAMALLRRRLLPGAHPGR